ncbi:MAG: thermonuclease family protein [Cyclobacteriaceae bacterium]|nr:thermonuclease family protein [Cyclobacteriaceae bacterium]
MRPLGTLVKHPVAFILIVLVLIFILLVSSKAAQAATMPPVQSILEVVDGNTLKVTTVEHDTFLVKLKGIDAPEPGQEFSNESKEYLQNLVNRKGVNIEYSGKDRWGNRLVNVTTKKGESVNNLMLSEGYAWVDRFFLNQADLMTKQDEAKTKKYGLWNQEDPMEPWVYDRIQIRLNSTGR